MNIFASHKDPEIAARNLDDKRVIKLILESAQLMSIGVVFALDSFTVKRNKRGHEYKSYDNHKCPELMKPHPMHNYMPVSQWTRATRGNYLWVLDHMIALCGVYTNFSGKHHAAEKRIPFLRKYAKHIPIGKRMPFQNSARNGRAGSYIHIADTVEAYRVYLTAKWDTDMTYVTWKNRKPPKWYDELSGVWLFVGEDIPADVRFRDNAPINER